MNENTSVPAGNGESDDEINLLDLLQVVAESLRLLVLGPLVVGLAALGISFAVTPTFTATTVFLPPQQQQGAAAMLMQSLGSLGGLAGAATGLKNPGDQYIALLKSDSVANALIDRFVLIARYKAELRVDAIKALENATRISSGKDGLITIDVDDADPQFAAQLANAYVEELASLQSRLALTEAQNRRVFFEKQLSLTKQKLVDAERALRATGVNISAIKSRPEAAITAVAQLQAQIVAQEIKVSSMRGYLTESAPDFKQALTELSALRSQFAKLEQSDSASPTIGKGASSETDYVGRYREFKYFETLFELFAKQFELAKVDEAREGAVIQVVDKAVPPERKSKPKKALIAVLATLATGFALLLFVFVRQALRNAAQDPEQQARLSYIAGLTRKALFLRS